MAMPNVVPISLRPLPGAVASWAREVEDMREALHALAVHLDGGTLPASLFDARGWPQPEHEATVATAVAEHIATLRTVVRPTDTPCDSFGALARDLIEPADQLAVIGKALHAIAERYQRLTE